MSVPESYTNIYKYFNDAVTFLKQNEWVYNFPNTDVLTENVFNKFPEDWRKHLEILPCKDLNEIPFGFCKDSWPESLKTFVKTAQALKPVFEIYKSENNEAKLPKSLSKGLSSKKQHEILHLSKFIHDHCQKYNISIIIDVGAGLGYLSHLLHEKYGYKILAIESETIRFNSALKRQDKYHSTSKNSVQYFQHYVNNNSAKDIDDFLNTWMKEDCDSMKIKNTCLIGLHACADLTITALNIFRKLNYIKLAIIMPCCYHKLEMPTEITSVKSSSKFSHESHIAEYFINFPLSDELKKIYTYNEAQNFLKRSFLRVACQSSANTWRLMTETDMQQHALSHLRRAVIQLFVIQEKYTLVKLKRKCMTRTTSSNCDFFTYLKQLESGFYLIKNNDNNEFTNQKDLSEPELTENKKENSNEGENENKQSNDQIQQSTNSNSMVDNNRFLKAYGPTSEIQSNIDPNLAFTSPKISEKLIELYEQNEPLLPAVSVLSALQNTIQAICENIILLDRVVWLEESNETSVKGTGVRCKVEVVTKDDVSPRCRALVTWKENES